MRMAALSVLAILAANGFANASPFTCTFGAESSPNDFSCAVETTTDWTKETIKCRKDFSDTLFGECFGRQPGGVDQLVCYYAAPVNPPLDPRGDDLIDKPSVRAVTIQWTGTFPPSAAPMLFYYKDASASRLISCTPNQLPASK